MARCAAAAVLLVLALAGCARAQLAPGAKTVFLPTQAPFPDENSEKHQIITAPTVNWDGTVVPLAYNTILNSGDKVNASDKFAFGQLIDSNGQFIFEVTKDGLPNKEYSDKANTTVVGTYAISANPDFASILQVGGRLFQFVHFESPPPAQIYMVELAQDTATCGLRAVSQKPVNWSSWGGVWTPCAGSVTPWQTHLGSEEYEPDARSFFSARNLTEYKAGTNNQAVNVIAYARYFGLYEANLTMESLRQVFNPYLYGHATELAALPNGDYVNAKHYAMGRLAYELPLVLPDNRTVYNTDDGENTMLTMYKAAQPGNLTCGTLYGAKFTQTSAANGGVFTIEWLSLGAACNSDFPAAFVRNLTFSQIFDTAPFANGSCPAGFKSVNAGFGAECLMLKAGQEKVASRFETRRYLAYIGGTTEFTKWEGITYSPYHGANGTLYTSMSEIRNSMEDMAAKGKNSTAFDAGGPNSIKLPYNPCGCVYQLPLNGSYAAVNMSALVCGSQANNTDVFNACDKNGIASPDNVAMLVGHDALLIGEDTTEHQNDVVWLYQFADKSLQRVQTTPYGSETTSVYWYPDINGCAYWMSVVQHPYGESDQDKVLEASSVGRAARVGYLGPLKTAAGDKGMRGNGARAGAVSSASV